MTSISGSFDALVIGSGPGGYVCAIRMAQLGLSVACVEKRSTLGGTCLNVGCIPSKALLESSHHWAHVKHDFGHHGIEMDLSSVKLNLEKMLGRKNQVVQSMTGGIDFLFKKNKITRLTGFASLEAAGLVRISQGSSEGLYQARHIIIATGSEPIQLPFAPFDGKVVVDSTAALDFDSVPEKLIVLGGGVIGLELGSVWNRLGSQVTIVEAAPKILGAMDRGISAAAQRIFEKQGLKIHLETKAQNLVFKKKGFELFCQDKNGQPHTFVGDKLLAAVGRKPYTEGLGLQALGVDLDPRGRVVVDHNFQTSVPGVYAIGDVISGPMLAHKAEEEGLALAQKLASRSGHVNYGAVAGIVYTWPEIASVGLTEEECKEKNQPYRTGQFFFKANGRAKAMGETDGLVKVIGCPTTDRLLGVHILGPMASEMIAEATMALEFGASTEDLGTAFHAHPTLAEAIKEAALDVEKRAIHS